MLPKTNSAGEIMVKQPLTLPPEMHVSTGIDLLLKHKITGAPVVDKDQNFLGVFSEKCWMKVLGAMAPSSAWTPSDSVIKAQNIMVSNLITFTPETDVFDAIGLLLKNRFSGSPVVNADGKFLGIFSEKNCMQVLISSAYDQLPTTQVGEYMNTDPGRIVSAESDLFDAAKKFAETPFRRLEVVDPDSGKLLGQICRRDVTIARQHLPEPVRHRVKMLASNIAAQQNNSSTAVASPSVGTFMDRNAMTVTEDVDFLDLARIFLDTPYRRLPVLDGRKVVGQISRRDVLNAAHDSLAADPIPREKSILYLSSLIDRQDAPFG